MSAIKISELNPMPAGSASVDDFFPIVDSGSMTTFRTTIGAMANVFTSSMSVSQSVHAVSASYSSASTSASRAEMAGNVALAGTNFYVPLWTSSLSGITNGNLKTSSPLYVSYSALAYNGIVGVYGVSSFTDAEIYPETGGFHQYYTRSYWYNYKAFTPSGNGQSIAYGLNVMPGYSIANLHATDMIAYNVATSSTIGYTDTFWSGSANSGSYAVVGTGTGALSQSLNGKWIRIMCESYFGGTGLDSAISMNAAKGEAGGGHSVTTGIFGRIVLAIGTTVYNGGSNVNQVLDFNLNDEIWGGGITATVNFSSVYSRDLVKMVRASIWTPKSGDPAYYPATSASRDPMMAVDVFVQDLNDADYVFSLRGISYGSGKFLREINVDPPTLCDTGSLGVLSPTGSSYLIFPPEPGHYSVQSGSFRNYNIQGSPVTIWPTRNERTASAWSSSMYRNRYSLNVSNSMNVTDRYYAGDQEGKSGTVVVYDAVASDWKQCVYRGGILVDSSSTATDPTAGGGISDTVAVGTIMAFGGTTIPNNWLECNGAAMLTESYSDLYTAIVNTDPNSAYGYLCDQYGNRNASGYYFKLPDLRGEFLRGWDHARGVDSSRATASYQAAGLGSHFHGMGSFTGASNNDAGFITRVWYDGNTYTVRSLPGDGSPGSGTWYSDGGGSAYGMGTTGPINATGDTRPRNVAAVYIIKYTNAVDFASSGTTLSGDVTGLVTNTIVVGLRGNEIDSTAPTNGQVLRYNSGTGKWVSSTVSGLGVGAQGRSWLVANPGTGFVMSDPTYLYVINHNRHTDRKEVVKIDMTTNAATFVCTSSNTNWNWYGRGFVLPDVSALTSSLERAYFFNGGGLMDFNLATGLMQEIPGVGGHYYDLPVSISFMSTAGNSASGSRPVVWCMYGSYNAGTYGDYPTVRWRKHFYRSGWTYDWASANLDLRTIQNSTEFLKFFNYSSHPGTGDNLLMWDYNYIKKRYYMMTTGTGYMHILTQDTGDFTTNWDGAYISYLKTIAVPSVDSSDWADADAEKIVVDYDPVTGDERGIIYTRRSNTSLLGVINYVTWPD